MKQAVSARRGAWGMAIPLVAWAVGALLVGVMVYLDRSQNQTSAQWGEQLREFRQARVELTSTVMHLGLAAAAGSGGATMENERAGVFRTLAQMEDKAAELGGESDGMATAVVAQVADLRRLIARGDLPSSTAAAGIKRSAQLLESSMDLLERDSVARVRLLQNNHRRQFDAAAAAALAVLVLFAIVCVDTQRRRWRTETALLASESDLRQTTEMLPQLVWSCNNAGQCDYFNARWTAYTGVSADHYLGGNWLELVHPDDRDAVAAQWQRIFAAGTESQSELRIRRHDGSYHWFDMRMGRVLDAQSQTVKWFGSCIDIDARKQFEADLTRHRDRLEQDVAQRTAALQSSLQEREQAQQHLQQANAQLKDAEAFMRLVADNVPGRIVYWDRGMRCRFVNRAYCDWFGIPREETVGRTMRELRGDEYFERTKARVLSALAGEPQDFEREEFSSAGERAVTRVQYLPDLRDGQIRGFFVQATNITRHKQSEELLRLGNAQLAEARDRADSANRAKSNFLANMSHEIRTPMNAIIGLTHMLRRDVTDPLHQTRLTKIWNAAHHLLQVINDILDLSKIEAGKLALDNVDFSLDALLTRTCAMVLDAAREKGLEVVLDTHHVPDHLHGDPTRLMQALLNLLGNAVKFTDRGSVTLRGELLAQDATDLTIRFEVRDTGIGIDPADVPELFSPFEQADGSSTRRHGGTGLGLAITRHIAELMGGSAGGDSVPGQGSRFWITVQLSPAHQTEVARAPVLAGQRSLVVDDLGDARDALAEMLRTLGLRADTASGGEEALRMAAAAEAAGDPYAAMLLDWAMPGMDGLETARRMQDLLRVRPPLVLVSARDQDGLQQIARDTGFGALLLKPVTPSVLLDNLMRLLSSATLPAAPLPPEGVEEALRAQHRGARVLLAEDNPVNQEVASELLQSAGLVVDIAGDGEQAVRMARHGGYDPPLEERRRG